MSATDAAVLKKVHDLENSKNSGTKTVNFSNKDLDDMTKIVKASEDSDVLMKGIVVLNGGIWRATESGFFKF